jgi:predicted permease
MITMTWARDLLIACRTLRRSRGLSAVSVATMGIGIGASAVLFALVDAVVLRPLPYPEPDALVRIVDTNVGAGVDRAGITTGNLHDWRLQTTSFAGIAGAYTMGRTLSTDTDATVVNTAQVTADFFTVAGIAPLLGRAFTAEEMARAQFSSAAAPLGPDPVVILSHALWRTRFGADPNVVGRTVTLERLPFRIVGVMPPAFALPDRDTAAWIPWHVAADAPRDQHYLEGLARLAPGRSLDDAQHDLATVAAGLAAAHPATNEGWGVRVIPLHEDTLGRTANVLWMLLGAVGVLLVVASANVGLLTLIRGLDHAGDSAVRLALGATPSRILREFLAESVIVSVVGAGLGVVLALAGLRVLPAMLPDLPRVEDVRLGGSSLAFILGLTVLAALLSGLPQAWRRTRLAPVTMLNEASARSIGTPRHALRDIMVVAQVALAVVLLTGAGLLVRSVRALSAVDPGFRAQGALVVPVFLDSQAYGNGERVRAYYRALFDRLAQVPGVSAVGGATTVPTSPLGPDFERPVWRSDAARGAADSTPAAVRIVTPGYFDAVGLRLAAGRRVHDGDHAASARVVMVSEGLARRLWPGQAPVGQQLVVDYSTAGTYPYEVIGVVGDTRFRGPRTEPRPEIYLAHAQRPYLILNVVVRASGDLRAVAPAVRQALREIDPQKPAHGVYPLEDLLDATYARDRQAMAVLSVFSVAATLLAVLSVYGVLAHRVRERSREIGIRMAMGAGSRQLLAWVVGAGARLVGVGLGTGLAGAAAVSSLLGDMLFGVEATDGMTYVIVAAALAGVAAVGTLAPAVRATRIDPVSILRRG